MIPPGSFGLRTESQPRTLAAGLDLPRFYISGDVEAGRQHQRRPSTIRRMFRHPLDTINEGNHGRDVVQDGGPSFFDNCMTEEPMVLDQVSPPQSPTLATTTTNRDEHHLQRPLPRRSTQFRRPTLTPANSPPPSDYYPRRTVSRIISMSNQVLAGMNIPDDRDTNALKQIWWTYAQEASEFDNRRLSDFHRSLDVRLIFSGIFSAILTPFIVESYKMLEEPPRPLKAFGADGYKIRVNAMWFGSLILSLIAALFSIHCKQWLDGYGADFIFAGSASGSHEGLINACRLRQYRYQGMQRYHIPELIGMLPILLYLALLFFAAGLIDFLWHLNRGIAIYISVLCGIVLLFHIGTTVLPWFTTRSPFKTPLSNFTGNLWRGAWQRCLPKGLMDIEERKDVDWLGAELDANVLKWLMKYTQSEDVYQESLRAERELLRQSKPSTPCA